MSSSSITEVQYGVLYQNGTEDWDTARWYGTIDIPESRQNFREQYDLRMAAFGMPKMEIKFLTRTVTVSFSDVTVVDDTVPPPAPEPEPTPEDEAPVVEDEVPAAPDEGVEPPTTSPPVEEELPTDTDATSGTDDEGVPADGK